MLFRPNLNASTRRMLLHITVIYGLTFCLILPILLHKVKYSAYFWEPGMADDISVINKGREKEWHANDERAKEAKKWVAEQRAAHKNTLWSSDSLDAMGQVDVIITVISMRRDRIDGSDPRYVTQTVARTFELLRDFQEESGYPNFFGLVLCNVDPDPKTYHELNFLARSLNLLQFVRFLSGSPSSVEQDNPYVKEQSDYSYCLRQSLEINPTSYIFLLEDDAVPLSNAFWLLHHFITHKLQHHIYASEVKNNHLGFVKFYHPYRFMGRARYSELIGLSAIFGTLFTIVYINLCMLWRRGNRITEVYICWVLFSLYACLVFLSLGHANILKLRHISPHLFVIEPAPECCTPAMLFTHKSGTLFADYYDAHPCKSFSPAACAMDLLLGSFLKESQSKGLMVQPNIFYHIGMYSIVKENVKNPDIID